MQPYHTAAAEGSKLSTIVYIVYNNKDLVYLYLKPSTVTSTGSLVGRPLTRGRIYVDFGEHPAAGSLYVFGTLGSYLGP